MCNTCPTCEGAGYVEEDDPRPHAFGFNTGYIDTKIIECPDCCGSGEIKEDQE